MVHNLKRGDVKNAVVITLVTLLFFVHFQSLSVYGGDGGDLITAAYVHGVPHPSGYPLYTFLGWLLTLLPIQTVAWRVGLLSSIPMSITVGVLYLTCTQLIKNRTVALVSAFIFAFTYLIWLFASITEVLALHILFASLIFLLLLLYYQTGKLKLLYLSSFILGLSATHHHSIVLLLPGYLYLIWPQFILLKHARQVLLRCLLCASFGLIPYLYIFIAARSHPSVNWEYVQTLESFVRLVTRAMYGSFKSGQAFGINPHDRIIQLAVFFENMFIDFTRLGVVLGLIGIIITFLQKRHVFWTLFLLFTISGPIFVFYAGFPSHTNFHLGTSEKFLLTPYLFWAVWMGFGINAVVSWVTRLLQLLLRKKVLLISPASIFLLVPFLFFFDNVSKISALTHDQTAEKLAIDTLKSVDNNSILLLGDDTMAFDTQYQYYTHELKSGKKRVKLFLLGLMDEKFYSRVVKDIYPELIVEAKTHQPFLVSIIKQNYEKFPIFSNLRIEIGPEYVWVKSGLVWRLYTVTDLKKIKLDDLIDANEQLFSSFNDPYSGALATYKHLLLADALRIYSLSHTDVAEFYLKVKKNELAEKHSREAIRLEENNVRAAMFLGISLSFEKKCEEAKTVFESLVPKLPQEVTLYSNLASLYVTCLNDTSKAKVYQKQYEEILKQQETKLDTY